MKTRCARWWRAPLPWTAIDTVTAEDGAEALEILTREKAPSICC